MKIKTTIYILFNALVLVVFFSTMAYAQTTITLDATKDNTLYEDSTKSNGAGPTFLVGRTKQGNNSKRRGLLQFDIAASVPSGATVTSVTLKLNAVRVKAGARDIKLHKVTKTWGAGSSNAGANAGKGATAVSGDATWVACMKDSTNWAAAGGDYEATVSATTSVNAIGAYTWSSTQMTADVQSWLDSSAVNFGWILIGDESAGQTIKHFDSKESTTTANRPQLEITYSEPVSSKRIAKETPIKVYPNPAQQLIYIERPSNSPITASLYNQQGRLVREEKTIATLIDWEIVDLSAGVYLLRIVEADKIYQQKIVVQP